MILFMSKCFLFCDIMRLLWIAFCIFWFGGGRAPCLWLIELTNISCLPMTWEWEFCLLLSFGFCIILFIALSCFMRWWWWWLDLNLMVSFDFFILEPVGFICGFSVGPSCQYFAQLDCQTLQHYKWFSFDEKCFPSSVVLSRWTLRF